MRRLRIRESNFLMEKPARRNYFLGRETSWAFPSTLLALRSTRTEGDLHRVAVASLPLLLSPPIPYPGTGNITGPAGCGRESP